MTATLAATNARRLMFSFDRNQPRLIRSPSLFLLAHVARLAARTCCTFADVHAREKALQPACRRAGGWIQRSHDDNHVRETADRPTWSNTMADGATNGTMLSRSTNILSIGMPQESTIMRWNSSFIAPYACSSSRSSCRLAKILSPRSRQASNADKTASEAPDCASIRAACPSSSARNSSASQLSFSLKAFTAKPRRPTGSSSPWVARLGRMFRTGVRDTPNFSANASSVTRYPGANSPERIISLIRLRRGASAPGDKGDRFNSITVDIDLNLLVRHLIVSNSRGRCTRLNLPMLRQPRAALAGIKSSGPGDIPSAGGFHE